MDTRPHDMRLHHVGVITGNLAESINFYTILGYAASAIYADPLQKARIVLMQKAHEPLVELIEPDSPDSPAASWIQRIAVGPYHTCYEVDDLEAMVAFLRRHRLFPVIKPVPAVAFNMRRVVFLWGESSGLLELLEALPREECPRSGVTSDGEPRHAAEDDPMKVLQVHGKDAQNGGGAISTYRLNCGLRKAGIDSRILCDHPTQPTSVAIPRAWRAERVLSRVTMRLGLNDVHCVGAFRIKHLPAFQEADVVNFHGIHGQFFSYLALPALTADKAAVFTVRDMWPLTGHCAVSYDCERWRIGCGHCPYPNAGPPLPEGRDGTRLEWKLKRWVYRHSRMTLVALSTRMTEQLQQSMLGHLPVSHIPNGVDTEAYQPLDQAMCRAALGLSAHKKVLLFAAGHLNRKNKGGEVLLKALHGLPPALQKDLVLLLMGEGGDAFASATDLDVWPMGYVGGARLKSMLYAAADLFVLPTFGEGLPNVLLESMACGTPMVSFDVGGVPDLVRPGVTGYLAAPADVDDLRHGILMLLEDTAGRVAMGQCCRDIAVKEYDTAYEVQRYIEIYQRVLRS